MNSLHERYVTVTMADGREERLSALDASRMENVRFVEFRPPPVDDSDQGAVDAWLERADYIMDDLRWVLKLPYDRFWCQLIYDSSLHRCIDSYLNAARRPHDLSYSTVAERHVPLDHEVTSRQMLLHRLFFLVCLRSSTHHESSTSFIDRKVFGDILYENYVFDIPRLMDICVVYGRGGDTTLVTKMIGNVFLQQPKYNDDLRTVVASVEKVFDTLCSKCGTPPKIRENSPPKLTSIVRPALESVSDAEFEDIIAYLSDVAHTLNSFLKVYSPGSSAFWDSRSFPVRLASAYECFAVVIPAAFRRRAWVSLQRLAVVKKQFRRSQVCLLRVFRLIVYHVCLRPVAERVADEDEVARGIEGYLDVMNAVLAERHFIAHLQVLFPFDGDRDIILQSSYLVDEPRLVYIEDAFRNAATKHARKHLQLEDGGLAEAQESDELCEFEADDEDACLSDVAGANLESMVSAVRDLLPELGRGFVELCLEEFAYDVEKVINALLEDQLPSSMEGVERTLENAHDTSAGLSVNSSSLLSQRRNVFDGDEFDVFSRFDVDLARVHQGKRDRDNDGDVMEPAVRARCVTHALQPVTVVDDDDDAYDDEYDDTYDSNVLGADDADSADEMTSRRPFVTPRVFRFADTNDDEEEQEQKEQETAVRRREAFVEDPAVLRQQRANRRAPAAGADQTAGSRDVKGAARGHGQTADVIRNRAWKEKNKATRVHHNRKDLADRKRRF